MPNVASCHSHGIQHSLIGSCFVWWQYIGAIRGVCSDISHNDIDAVPCWWRSVHGEEEAYWKRQREDCLQRQRTRLQHGHHQGSPVNFVCELWICGGKGTDSTLVPYVLLPSMLTRVVPNIIREGRKWLCVWAKIQASENQHKGINTPFFRGPVFDGKRIRAVNGISELCSVLWNQNYYNYYTVSGKKWDQ